MDKLNLLFFATLTTLVISTTAQAQDRGFISDRPGAADNPLTSKPGQYRLEASVLSTDIAHEGSEDQRSYSFGSFFFIAGVTENSELQFGIDGYQTDEEPDSEKGMGPTTLRYKYNVMGNQDPYSVGVALIPWVEHTGSLGGNKTNLGFGVAVSKDLPHDFNFGTTLSWAQTQNDNLETESSYSLPLVLGYEISDKNSVFAQTSFDFDKDFRSVLSGGFGTAYILRDNLELDAEFNYSEEESVKNYELLVGFTMLFEP